MKIIAKAYLYYNEGESISCGWEDLQLHVKFKQEGKLLRTKLERTLVSTFNVANAHLCEEEDRIDSYDDYYKLVHEIIEDIDGLKREATDMIIGYFEKKSIQNGKAESKKELAERVNGMPVFEITVEIKK